MSSKRLQTRDIHSPAPLRLTTEVNHLYEFLFCMKVWPKKCGSGTSRTMMFLAFSPRLAREQEKGRSV